MPLTLEELQEMRAKLVRARMSGTREIEDQNGERVAYKSDSEMRNAIAAADAEIARLHINPPIKTIRFDTTKG